jgi:hypothetical protein
MDVELEISISGSVWICEDILRCLGASKTVFNRLRLAVPECPSCWSLELIMSTGVDLRRKSGLKGDNSVYEGGAGENVGKNVNSLDSPAR